MLPRQENFQGSVERQVATWSHTPDGRNWASNKLLHLWKLTQPGLGAIGYFVYLFLSCLMALWVLKLETRLLTGESLWKMRRKAGCCVHSKAIQISGKTNKRLAVVIIFREETWDSGLRRWPTSPYISFNTICNFDSIFVAFSIKQQLIMVYGSNFYFSDIILCILPGLTSLSICENYFKERQVYELIPNINTYEILWMYLTLSFILLLMQSLLNISLA